MIMKTLSQATKSNRRHAGKYKNYSLALQHTISIFSDFVSNLFFKFPIFLSDYFVLSILMSNFFLRFFLPDYLSVLFECPIFCPIFFVGFFVRSS